ncbi:FMN-dependent NADH-azoreductase [Sediminitomix flava]|uniref:FMN dependent NADH:quinone oxidoreductase n=1 Tax=Sediminitomix flava TaxID=379075 RepID=A0A315ZGT9_SEDFL|nr:NAD(P)H-dependent oxidoreductase [Sediminitomix flava]PWJ44383.1 FMN-dependent NADH-azoreductase [Sediminitomix flava]
MTILKINSSLQDINTSASRQLVEEIIKTINTSDAKIIEKDLAEGLPLLSPQMLGAFFTPEGDRTAEQKEEIAVSDQFIAELLEADTLVIGAPMYNFGVTASLKAYFDLVARAGVTFKYTENGPVGLLEGKKAYVVISTGGTPLGSDWDHTSNHIKTFLGFIGITDVTIVDASLNNGRVEEVVNNAKAKIAELSSESIA